MTAIRAAGAVRDEDTGAWLSDARLSFARQAERVGPGVRGVSSTNDANRWVSQTSGAFPDDVWLPTVDWDLAVTRAGYSNLTRRRAILSPAPSSSPVTLEPLWLAPLDSDGDGVSDEWQSRYFPGGRCRRSTMRTAMDWTTGRSTGWGQTPRTPERAAARHLSIHEHRRFHPRLARRAGPGL